MVTFLRDIVLPIAVTLTLIGTLYFTYVLITLGSVPGAVSTGLLSAAIAYFVYNDAKRLLAKIS